MTSTHSASDLLNSFAPCFSLPLSLLVPSETCLLISINWIFTLSNDSLLVTSSLPVANVLRDLELMIAAQHYRAASVLCCTTDILHLVAELNSEVYRLFHLITTWIVKLISAPSRDRQQPC